MSASGLSGKQHGEKSTVSGKKYQSVNINSVYNGKSLLSQKTSAPSKHGLQSLGKATATARRMPPPANLPSLKSESAGQDPTVHLVPSGVPGWGNTQQQQQQDPQQSVVDDAAVSNSKGSHPDGVSLRPASASTTPASSSATVSSSATQSTSSRQTWSTRIGANTTNVVNSATSGGAGVANASAAAAGFFSSRSAQEFPKLAIEQESAQGSGPSLRPQKSGNWKAGGVKTSTSAADVASMFTSQNGRDSSPSSESPASHHTAPLLPPPSHSSHRPSSAPQPPHPATMFPPYSIPPPPPHPSSRQSYPFPYPPYGMFPPPPHMPPNSGGRYGPNYGGYGEKGGGGSYSHHGGRMGPNLKDCRAEAMDESYSGGGSRGSGGQAPMPPPPPPQSYRRGPLMGPPQSSGGYYEPRDAPPPNRMGSGDNWSGSYGREPVSSQSQHYVENNYDDRGVWSDDEISERERHYRHDQRLKRAPVEDHSWSDTDERYEYDYEYDERRHSGRGPPQHMRQNRGFPGGTYGPPPMPPPSAMRDSRYMPPPPPPMNYGYVNYDRQMAPPPPPPPQMSYPPPLSYQVRDPHDLEAEEEEEMKRQRKQQHARDAAIERSRQKRLLAQESFGSTSSRKWQSDESHFDEISEPRFEDDVDNRNRSLHEEEEEDDHKFETLSKPTKVVKRTAGMSEKAKDTVLNKDHSNKDEQRQQQSATKKESVGSSSSSGNDASATEKSQKQKAEEQQENIWEKRSKEQMEKQKETGVLSDNATYIVNVSDVYSKRSSYSTKDDNWSAKSKRDSKNDQLEEEYDDKAPDDGRSGRGRGSARGRVRREFVPSRRNHGGSSLSTARRSHGRDAIGGSSGRRGGSVPRNGGRSGYREKYDAEESSKKRSTYDNIDSKHSSTPPDEKDESFEAIDVPDDSAPPPPPASKVSKGHTSSRKKYVGGADEEQQPQSEIPADDENQSYAQLRQRDRQQQRYSSSSYGSKRISGGRSGGSDYSGRGYYGQQPRSRYYDGGRSYFGGNEKSSKSYSHHNSGEEFDPRQLKDAGFVSSTADYSEQQQSDGKTEARSRGSRRGGGVPPRFSGSRGGGGGRYDAYYGNEQHASSYYGRRSTKQSHNTGGDRSNNSNQGQSTAAGAGSGGGTRSASSAKSPTGQRDNQSEGNDEWETASESSDVGERRRRPKPEKKDESYDKKRQSTNAPKSFSAQRRSNENNNNRGGNSVSASNRLVWGPNSGTNRHSRNQGGEPKSDGSQDLSEFNGKNQSGPKNVNVASHQAPFGVDRNITDAHHQSPTRSSNNPHAAAATAKKTAKKEEKPASKSDALATVNLNNIAGVVVIDDQPDIVSVADSQEGFQEVISKKERRNRKDFQNQDDVDHKSRSPARMAKLQSRGNSIGNSKQEKDAGGVGVSSATSKKQHSSHYAAAINVVQKSDSSVFSQQHTATVSTTALNGAHFRPASPAGNWDQSPVDTSLVYQSSVAVKVPTDAKKAPDARPAVGDHISSSKTGVEIWGTPDPVPFSGASGEQSNQPAKCVVRPSKQGDNAQLKSVEFIAEGFNNVAEDSHVKIDFTFDADLAHGFNNKDKQTAKMSTNTTNSVNSPLESQQAGGVGHPLTSPSTDQLSEKIASVKKVWDNCDSVMLGEDSACSQQSNSSTAGGAASIDDVFFANATDAQTAAIAGAAYSMSQAVLQQSDVQQSSQYTSNDGIKTQSSVIITSVTGNTVVHASSGAAPIVASSKTEGPNVAKVRPQQMRVPETFARPSSYAKIEDAVINAGVYMPPLSSPTAVYGSATGGNVLFPSYHHQLGGKQPPQSQQGSLVDPFVSAATAIRPYLYHQQMSNQNPALVLAPQPQIDPNYAAYRTGGAPQSSAASPFGNAESYAAFAVGMQSVRPPPPTPQNSIFAKGATNPAVTAGPFLVQDANPASLFTQPPPPIATARASQQQPPHAQQQQASNMYPFAQTAPAGVGPALIQSAAFGGSGQHFGSKYIGGGQTSSNYAPAKPPSNILGSTYSNWSSGTGGVVPPNQSGKVFNPTIGPPNQQHKSNAAPAVAAATFNTAALMNLISSGAGNAPSMPPSSATASGLGAYASRSSRTISGGSSGMKQNVVAGATGDHSKRDGDLLQQIDNFINSTGGDDDPSLASPNIVGGDCVGNAMSASSDEGGN